jgi:virulence factor Mce-like protein
MTEFGGKRASVAIGLAVALALAFVSVAATGFSLDAGRNDYEVKIHFPTANGLIEGSDVFFGGVKVGTVARIVVDGTPPADNGSSSFSAPTQTATVTVSIGKDYAPIHQGATAAVRPKSLLGEKYVAMTVGDPSRPVIPDSSTLPASATSVNVELDQLVNVFDAPTRAQLQKLIDSLGIGLAGQGRKTNQTLQVGRQDLTNLGNVTDVLQARDAELRRVIEALTKITATLATDQQRSNYPDLLAHSDAVLKTLIDEDASVAQGIDRMNTFFGQVEAGLAGRQADLQSVLTDLPRTVSDLDALSSTLGPQGHVGLGIVQTSSPGVIGGDLVFGSQPVGNTYTRNVYTRVMPAQGCFTVNGRSFDSRGFATDNLPPTRPGTGNPTGLCTLPVFAGNVCANPANPVASAQCLGGLAGALCVIESLPASVCDTLTGGVGGAAAANARNALLPTSPDLVPASPLRGPLGLPIQAAPGSAATDGLLNFLLR